MKNQHNSSSTAAQADWFLTGCGAFIFIVTLIWAAFFVPMNMDEAGIFHVLACSHYPYAVLHTFRDACQHQQDITTFFGVQLSHPESYTGIWDTILYAPLYFTLHSPYGQYLFGLIFFGLFAWLLSRENKKPYLSLAIYLGFFPFLFQFIHDMGPVKFAMLLFPLGALLLRKTFDASAPLSYAFAVLLAVLCVCATEEKAFFLYLLPSLALFSLALSCERDDIKDLTVKIKNAWIPLLVGDLVGGIGILILLFSINQKGIYYIDWLMDIAQRPYPFDAWASNFIDFMTYWPSFAHNYYLIRSDFSGAILFRLALAVFIVFCIAAAHHSKFLANYSRTRLMLLLASVLITVLIFVCVRNEWAGHHFVFLWVPLLVLFADLAASLTPGVAMIAVGGFFALNLWSVIAATQLNEIAASSSERKAIFDYFDNDAIASQAIINFSSWGGYYIQAIYGPITQLVTYTEPHMPETARTTSLAPQDAQQLLALAQHTNRRIYNVCYGALCNKRALEGIFGDHLVFEEVLPGLPHWHVFAATENKKK